MITGVITGAGNVVGGVFTTAGELIEDTVGPLIEDQFEEIDLAIALILGVIVAGFGGFMGVKDLREDYERHHAPFGEPDPGPVEYGE